MREMLRLPLVLALVGCAAAGVALNELHVPCPTGCSCDLSGIPRRVVCSNLNLTQFPTDLHSSTQFLDLSFNLISALPPRLSHVAPQLETLILKQNQISLLPEDTFLGLQDLRTIDLSFNSLSSKLPSKLLLKNSRILELNVSNNFNLTELGNLISTNLEHLDASRCRIGAVGSSTVANLTALRTLNLGHNPLRFFPEGFSNPTLRHLDISHANLSVLHQDSLVRLPHVQHLHISGNKNLDLPKNPALHSRSLLLLTADHCDIKHLALSQLPALTHGYFSCNKITGVRRENFAKKSALLEIDLSHNLIRELPKDLFMNANSLVSVDLSSNRIEALQHDLFACCSELQFLNLSRNDIAALPTVLTMPSMAVFDLSRCRLQSLPSGSNFLARMTNLHSIYLSHNELHKIPALKSSSLKHLDLSYCHLKQVTADNFSNLTKLHKINLSGNRLTTLNASIFNDNSNLGSLYLEDNPWFCNCTDPEFKKLWELMERLSETGRNTLKCQDPESVSGQFWEAACNILIPSEPNTSAKDNNAFLLSFILVACLCTIVAAIMCSKKVIGPGRKASRRRQNQQDRGAASGDDDSDDAAVSVHVPRARIRSADTRQCTPCTEREIQVIRAAAEQPPTYEEAVLLTASTASIAIIEYTPSSDVQSVSAIEEDEVDAGDSSSDESDRERTDQVFEDRLPQVSEL